MQEAINAFLLGFPALFSIVNPLSGAFIFGGVTEGRPIDERCRLARQVAIYSLLVMMVALWAGSFVLAIFGITLAALRVAGGVVVALTAWELLNRPEHLAQAGAGGARRRIGRHRPVPDDHSHHHRSWHHGGRGGAEREPAARA
jgi:small neutral amino acid transporter SnatA (MarC family)